MTDAPATSSASHARPQGTTGARRRCRICGTEGRHRTLEAREMMFGMLDAFEYFQCGACECLQITTVPADLSRYYPDNYYSKEAPLPERAPWPRDWVRRAGSALRLRAANPGRHKRREIFDWLRTARVGYRSAILDVGCGRGRLLHDLWLDGFRDLTGADPFIDAPLAYDNGIRVRKATLEQVQGSYDLIMMHHSFEHVPEPLAVLRAAAERLRPGGCVLIRVPLASSHAFRTYGASWFQLDAPRHLYLHTPRSLHHLALHAGLSIGKVIYDSKASQFWGSEQYLRGIWHRAPTSHGENPDASVFTAAQIRHCERQSRRLNAEQDGDAAAFFLWHAR